MYGDDCQRGREHTDTARHAARATRAAEIMCHSVRAKFIRLESNEPSILLCHRENSHLELREISLGELDVIVRGVNKQVPVASADAAVAFHDFAAWVVEGRRCDDVVFECAAVAGRMVLDTVSKTGGSQLKAELELARLLRRICSRRLRQRNFFLCGVGHGAGRCEELKVQSNNVYSRFKM